MEPWLVALLYASGLVMVVAETVLPGVIMGLVGLGLMGTSIYYGFEHHWAIGTVQIVVALVVTPLSFYFGIQRMMLKTSLEGAVPFAGDYARFLGQEGEAHTDLRPAGIVLINGRKVDVVTSGEPVDKGARVRVVKVEGNRIVVRIKNPVEVQ